VKAALAALSVDGANAWLEASFVDTATIQFGLATVVDVSMLEVKSTDALLMTVMCLAHTTAHRLQGSVWSPGASLLSPAELNSEVLKALK
jgi:hypothetical protein